MARAFSHGGVGSRAAEHQERLKTGFQAHPAPWPEELDETAFFLPELYNRYADPACAEILAEMKSRLADWLIETEDPARPPARATRASEFGPQAGTDGHESR